VSSQQDGIFFPPSPAFLTADAAVWHLRPIPYVREIFFLLSPVRDISSTNQYYISQPFGTSELISVGDELDDLTLGLDKLWNMSSWSFMDFIVWRSGIILQ